MNKNSIPGLLLALFMLAGCGVSKMTYEYPLNADNQKKIYDLCNYSKSFGQLDTWAQADTPYHLYLQSGFYDKDHFSLSLIASPNKDGDAFSVKMVASGGDRFVKNVTKQQRKNFLMELKGNLSGGASE